MMYLTHSPSNTKNLAAFLSASEVRCHGFTTEKPIRNYQITHQTSSRPNAPPHRVTSFTGLAKTGNSEGKTGKHDLPPNTKS